MLESLLDKVAGSQACNFIKKRLQQRCFPMKFAEFLRTPILKNICKQLLLKRSYNLETLHFLQDIRERTFTVSVGWF